MTDYRSGHAAPGPEEDGTTVRLDQVGTPDDMVFPRDVTRHPERYGGTHDDGNRQVSAARANPDALVSVWRAVPEGVDAINPGDWVAISRDYAVQHGASERAPRVLEAKVLARELWSEGLLDEWGYQGEHPVRGRAIDERKSPAPKVTADKLAAQLHGAARARAATPSAPLLDRSKGMQR